MRITIAMGFFLPVPPAAGGATEKSWSGLSAQLAAAGHEVTVVSRRWPGWPDDERIEGVRHVRLPGFSHTSRLATNLWRDWRWSRRLTAHLPASDCTVVNCLSLPLWLKRRRPDVGRVVVMTGRMPKGQYRLYRHIDHVLAVSSPVRSAILRENPRLRDRITVTGYPIHWSQLSALRERAHNHRGDVVTIGYVGRIHREKGLELLAEAVNQIAQSGSGPRIRVLICGPVDVARGGSGPEYATEVRQRFVPNRRVSLDWREPVFDERGLHEVYGEIDLFCYPSLAADGETFGVAVAEAMAAGAVPVVSGLACFRDFVYDSENGRVFDHAAPNATAILANILDSLVRNEASCRALATSARCSTEVYDFASYAQRLEQLFSGLK